MSLGRLVQNIVDSPYLVAESQTTSRLRGRFKFWNYLGPPCSFTASNICGTYREEGICNSYTAVSSSDNHRFSLYPHLSDSDSSVVQ